MKRETSKHPKGEMSAEAKERARVKANVWYAENTKQARASSRKYSEAHPEVAKRTRDNAIAAAPVIHDADRFERIEEAMASNKSLKGE